MSRIALPHSLPLPRGWPRRVRSAVVQVISLARTSLALTQSWASDSMNRQLRLQAEGDRLQQEIQLLREEIRIKDLPHGATRGAPTPSLSAHPATGDSGTSGRSRLVSRPDRPDLPGVPTHHRFLDGASRRGRTGRLGPSA